MSVIAMKNFAEVAMFFSRSDRLLGGDGHAGRGTRAPGGRLGGEVSEERIAAFAGGGEVSGAERGAHALLGEWRRVHGIVHEPRTVVVPEMVVGILRVDTEGGSGDEE